jgi:hypothetical protein
MLPPPADTALRALRTATGGARRNEGEHRPPAAATPSSARPCPSLYRPRFAGKNPMRRALIASV